MIAVRESRISYIVVDLVRDFARPNVSANFRGSRTVNVPGSGGRAVCSERNEIRYEYNERARALCQLNGGD